MFLRLWGACGGGGGGGAGCWGGVACVVMLPYVFEDDTVIASRACTSDGVRRNGEDGTFLQCTLCIGKRISAA